MSAIGRNLADIHADGHRHREVEVAALAFSAVVGMGLVALVGWFVLG